MTKEYETKIKILDLFTGNPVAIIHPKTADYLGIKSKGRILISSTSNPKKSLSSIVDISPKIVKKNQIAISHELEERLSLKENEFVEADLAPIPKSLVYIKKKLNKGKLNQKEINHIIGEITNNSLAETEIALFISSMYTNGMDLKETIYLINSILNSGQKLSLN